VRESLATTAASVRSCDVSELRVKSQRWRAPTLWSCEMCPYNLGFCYVEVSTNPWRRVSVPPLVYWPATWLIQPLDSGGLNLVPGRHLTVSKQARSGELSSKISGPFPFTAPYLGRDVSNGPKEMPDQYVGNGPKVTPGLRPRVPRTTAAGGCNRCPMPHQHLPCVGFKRVASQSHSHRTK
jgi:hypothetical protein